MNGTLNVAIPARTSHRAKLLRNLDLLDHEPMACLAPSPDGHFAYSLRYDPNPNLVATATTTPTSFSPSATSIISG